jgi:hypothetical protein
MELIDNKPRFLQHALQSVQSYFSSFSRCDRIARSPHSHTMAAYLNNLVTCPMSRVDAVKLTMAVMEAESRIQRTGRTSERYPLPPWILSAGEHMPWRIALIDDAAENGWPHTHGTVICMPVGMTRGLLADPSKNKRLVELLVHERIHVLQRLDPALTRHVITEWYGSDVRPFGARRDLGETTQHRLRSNPDIDGYVYGGGYEHVSVFRRTCSFDDTLLLAVPGPSSLDDKKSEGRGTREHPYEAMAYDFARAAVDS